MPIYPGLTYTMRRSGILHAIGTYTILPTEQKIDNVLDKREIKITCQCRNLYTLHIHKSLVCVFTVYNSLIWRIPYSREKSVNFITLQVKFHRRPTPSNFYFLSHVGGETECQQAKSSPSTTLLVSHRNAPQPLYFLFQSLVLYLAFQIVCF